MKLYSDKAPLELTFEEVAQITNALISVIDRLINCRANPLVVRTFLGPAKKLNAVLKTNDFNHYTDERFEQYENYTKDESQGGN